MSFYRYFCIPHIISGTWTQGSFRPFCITLLDNQKCVSNQNDYNKISLIRTVWSILQCCWELLSYVKLCTTTIINNDDDDNWTIAICQKLCEEFYMHHLFWVLERHFEVNITIIITLFFFTAEEKSWKGDPRSHTCYDLEAGFCWIWL